MGFKVRLPLHRILNLCGDRLQYLRAVSTEMGPVTEAPSVRNVLRSSRSTPRDFGDSFRYHAITLFSRDLLRLRRPTVCVSDRARQRGGPRAAPWLDVTAVAPRQGA